MLTFLSIIFTIILTLACCFVLWVWPALICYKQANDKNLFGHYNWASVFIGLFFGWIGAVVLIILKD